MVENACLDEWAVLLRDHGLRVGNDFYVTVGVRLVRTRPTVMLTGETRIPPHYVDCLFVLLSSQFDPRTRHTITALTIPELTIPVHTSTEQQRQQVLRALEQARAANILML